MAQVFPKPSLFPPIYFDDVHSCSAAANLEGYTNQSPRLPLTDDEHASPLLYLAARSEAQYITTTLPFCTSWNVVRA